MSVRVLQPTTQTATAVLMLYNKMFKGILPYHCRVTQWQIDRLKFILSKYGRKRVCVVFRYILSEINLRGIDNMAYMNLTFILLNFQMLLDKAYQKKHEQT